MKLWTISKIVRFNCNFFSFIHSAAARSIQCDFIVDNQNETNEKKNSIQILYENKKQKEKILIKLSKAIDSGQKKKFLML